MSSLTDYVGGLTHVLNQIDNGAFEAIVDAIRDAHDRDAVIFICGNGGSAATASHMVNDLVKAPADASGCRPFRAISLTDCVPLMTALANDVDYGQAMARQLEALGRPGDLLVAISGSGNSQNVLEAARVAREKGMRIIGLTGYQGGKLGPVSDIHLNVPCNCIAQVEDAHLIVEHAVVEKLKVVFGGHSSAHCA